MKRSMRRGTTKAAQGGVALIFALLGLVVLTLGAVALIRSVDTSVLALGNLSMKQSALMAGTRRADDALIWLGNNLTSGALDNDIPDQGYYASSMDGLDPTGRSVPSGTVLALVDWDGNGCLVNGSDPGPSACLQASAEVVINGDRSRYVITRMCNTAGNQDAVASTVICAVPPIPATTEGQGASGGQGYKSGGGTTIETYNPYYRVLTRTITSKGTVSFSETLAHF